VPQSLTLSFTHPADFVAAIPKDGTSRRLVITGHGRFRARLTWIDLDSLHVVAGEESLSRIAFVRVPDHLVLVVLQRAPYPAPIWGDIVMRPGEILTFGPGATAHTRTEGPCQWATILVPVRDLARYGRGMVGDTGGAPIRAQRWLPPRESGKLLLRLHAAVIRAVETGHPELISREAAHGLEQQIIEALIECLSPGPITADTLTTRRDREIMGRFEGLFENQHHDNWRVPEIAAALGISQWALRHTCQIHLGMSAFSYLRLRRVQIKHRARRGGGRGVVGIDLHR